MPPRKKQRGAALAQSFAAGAATPVNATSVDALHQVQRDCAPLGEDLYSLRHATETDVYSEPRGILPLEGNGLFPWPVLHGGTFKEIAERAMKDTDLLVNISTELCFHLGLLDVQDDAEFLQQFCKIDASRPKTFICPLKWKGPYFEKVARTSFVVMLPRSRNIHDSI